MKYPTVLPLSRTAVSEVLAKAVQARIQAVPEATKGWDSVKAMAIADCVGLLTHWKNQSVKGAFASAKALAMALDSNASQEALVYRGAFVVKAPKAPAKAPKAPAKAKAPKAPAKAPKAPAKAPKAA